jgi:hypothetical protein
MAIRQASNEEVMREHTHLGATSEDASSTDLSTVCAGASVLLHRRVRREVKHDHNAANLIKHAAKRVLSARLVSK